MAKKKKTKKPLVIPGKRPDVGWGPDTVRGLRWEQKKLRDIAALIDGEKIAFNNNSEGLRRTCIRELCEIVIYPDRHTMHQSILRAALDLYAYSDRVASAVLKDVADDDYERYIRSLKELRQIDRR